MIDIIQSLTDNERPRKYWSDLKSKLKKRAADADKIGQLKISLKTANHAFTDVADTETLLRLIQSVPSPRAEPLSYLLAGASRLRAVGRKYEDPRADHRSGAGGLSCQGYSKEWINQRQQQHQKFQNRNYLKALTRTK
ncbi:MAG: hypothetical protein R3E67_01910 [Pseudomonadales bacterium]